ncbi:MAG: Calx-beta domain-containing protein [Pseudomonadota bacterium]
MGRKEQATGRLTKSFLIVLLLWLLPGAGALAGVDPVITLTSADTTADEAGPDGASFTVTRDVAATGALTVNLSLGGTATRNVDYQAGGVFGSAPQAVSIPANQTSVTINILTLQDNMPEGPETIDVALEPGTGYTLGAATSEQITIADSVTEVSLTAADTAASEQGQDTASFTVARTNAGNFSQALTVNLQILGTATRNVDYTAPGVFGSSPLAVSIPANMLSTTVVVTPLLDNFVEGTETVDVQLQTGGTYTVGAEDAASIDIADDVAEVRISAVDGDADEQGQAPGSFTVTRTNAGNIAQALTVNLQVVGTAQRNVDYSLPGVFGGAPFGLTIPANMTQATFTLTPLQDNVVEGSETVEINLLGNPSTYTLGAPTEAIITIADDVAEINLTVLDADASEAASDLGQVRVSRTRAGNIGQALTVRVSVQGSAQFNVDYTTANLVNGNPGFVTIPSGQESVLVDLNPRQDNLIEGDETIELTLLANPDSYVLGSATQGTITIADDVPEVSLSVINATASESGLVPATVEITRSDAGNIAQGLTVNLSLGGTAQRNFDYTAPLTGSSPLTVSIPGNVLTLTLNFTPRADAPDDEGDETIELALLAGANYVLAGSPPVTLTLEDLVDALFANSFEGGVTSKGCSLDQVLKNDPQRFVDLGALVQDQHTGLYWTRCGVTGVYDAAAARCREAPRMLMVDSSVSGFNAGLAGDNAGFSDWRQPDLHDQLLAAPACSNGLLVR